MTTGDQKVISEASSSLNVQSFTTSDSFIVIIDLCSSDSSNESDEPPQMTPLRKHPSTERLSVLRKPFNTYDRGPTPPPGRPLSPEREVSPESAARTARLEEDERRRDAQTQADEKFREALADATSPESVYWRYKYYRRLHRLDNGFTRDSVYRSKVLGTRKANKISEKEMAAREPYGMLNCYSRVKDYRNTKVGRNDGKNYPMTSPWTVPELRAWYDFQEQEEQWCFDHDDLEVEYTVTRGQNGHEQKQKAQYKLREQELLEEHKAIQEDHQQRLSSKSYEALFLAEEEEDKDHLKRAIELRYQRCNSSMTKSTAKKRTRKETDRGEEYDPSKERKRYSRRGP